MYNKGTRTRLDPGSGLYRRMERIKMFRNVWSRKRMLAVCCIIAVLAGMLAGCSNKAGGTADETTAAAETAVETTAAETAAETTAEETAAAETAAVETAAETAAAEATAAGTTAAEMAAAGTEEAETTAAPESGETEAGAEDKAPTDKVADASEMTDVQEVVEEGMVPVYASGLKDGTITRAELEACAGRILALSGHLK